MTIRALISKLVLQEDINFLLTNRIPRQLLTRFMGWFSQIEQPLVRDLSIATWKFFADLDLSDARKTEFRSLHDCFTRQLKEGARVVNLDPNILCSPSDGIVGACGQIAGTELIQAKGFPYTLLDLLGDPAMVEYYRDGSYVTLRLTSSMYHRFHAPADCSVSEVNYISGDTWNVNPIALKRVEKLFCKNERALIETMLTNGQRLLLVPVAAILVASIRLHFIDVLLHIRYRGPNRIPCQASFAKGEEMGWFQHGSTIIVFAPKGFSLAEGIKEGVTVAMGQGLLRQS
ncbi:MAG: archaetidylserine decarboxylase [Rhodocyclaceae bacterium]|nr:archaetidylserine decarboxylase [Rhodocyclaceae bacterium]